jgi:hypothetical protein
MCLIKYCGMLGMRVIDVCFAFVFLFMRLTSWFSVCCDQYVLYFQTWQLLSSALENILEGKKIK